MRIRTDGTNATANASGARFARDNAALPRTAKEVVWRDGSLCP